MPKLFTDPDAIAEGMLSRVNLGAQSDSDEDSQDADDPDGHGGIPGRPGGHHSNPL